jgi:hypothetical protein
MTMLGLTAPRGNDVNVEIEETTVGQDQIAESRLLCGLAQGGNGSRLLVLDVTAHLKPAIETPMMMKEKATAIVDDEAARGEMTRHEMPAGKRLSCGPEQIDHRTTMVRLDGIGRIVRAELLQELMISSHADGNQ